MATMNDFFATAVKKIFPCLRTRSSQISVGDVETNEDKELSSPEIFKCCKSEATKQDEEESEDDEEFVDCESDDSDSLDYLFGDAYDTHSYDRESEEKNKLQPNFLKGCNVSPGQRKQMLKWLLITFQSISSYDQVPEVHHLAVAIFDRYMQAERKIPSKQLKLVAISSVLIAVKMEDGLRTEMTLEDCAILTTCKYTRPEVAEMERNILLTLKFNVIIPSSYHFLERCYLLTKPCEMEKFCGMYLLEIGFSFYGTCHIYPSLQAAAANFIITALSTEPSDLARLWSPALRYYTEYNLADLKPVVRLLAGELHRITKKAENNIIFSKYAEEQFGQISKVVANSLPWIKKLKKFN